MVVTQRGTAARRLLGALLGLALLGLGPAARAEEKVTVAALTFVSSAPLFIAYEKGYFAEAGLDVEFRFFRAAQPVAVAIAAGDADFGVTAFTAGFFNLAGKGALKVIGAQLHERAGYDGSAILVSNKAHAAGFKLGRGVPGPLLRHDSGRLLLSLHDRPGLGGRRLPAGAGDAQAPAGGAQHDRRSEERPGRRHDHGPAHRQAAGGGRRRQDHRLECATTRPTRSAGSSPRPATSRSGRRWCAPSPRPTARGRATTPRPSWGVTPRAGPWPRRRPRRPSR